MLLVLVGYASVKNATHNHGPATGLLAGSGISSSEDKDSSGAPGSDHKSHCATCRLQRNFNSALRSPTVSIELIKQPVPEETCHCALNLLGALLVFSGRGPPLGQV